MIEISRYTDTKTKLSSCQINCKTSEQRGIVAYQLVFRFDDLNPRWYVHDEQEL